MSNSKHLSRLNRRNFLRITGLTGGALLSSGVHGLLSSCSAQSRMNQGQSTIRAATASFTPDLEIDLQATPKAVQIRSGQPTQVWTYDAKLVKGDPNNVRSLPDSFLGPVIRARQGQRVRVNFQNNLPAGQPSVVHWHGLMLPEDVDGHPRYAIQPGQRYVHEFEVMNSAGTNWFHPHPDRLTGSIRKAPRVSTLLCTHISFSLRFYQIVPPKSPNSGGLQPKIPTSKSPKFGGFRGISRFNRSENNLCVHSRVETQRLYALTR